MKNVFIAILTAASCFVLATQASAGDVKPYPLKTCIVSGEELGAMGKPVTFVKDGQEVKLCCKPCLKKFNKEADKYLKELSQAGKK